LAGDGAVEGGGLPPVERGEAVVLVGEVLVDERPGDLGTLRDAAHRHARRPVLGHQALGDVEQSLAPRLRVEAFGRGVHERTLRHRPILAEALAEGSTTAGGRRGCRPTSGRDRWAAAPRWWSSTRWWSSAPRWWSSPARSWSSSS